MKTTQVLALTSFALGSLLAITPLAPAATTTVEIADGDANSLVTVADMSRREDKIIGTLVNRGGDEVRDIRLLIDVAFLWKNELHPGEDSPGRSAVLTVAGPIAPHGRLAFEFTPTPPLAERSDGRYADPKVRVMGYNFVSAQ